MKSFITTILITTSLLVFGQSNLDDLIGKWKYQDVYEKEKIDSAGMKMIEVLFGNMTMQFNEDGMYKAFLMGKDDQGKWNSEDKKTISLASDNGRITTMELIELDKNKLIFKLQSASFIMSKVQGEEIDAIVEKEKTFATQKASLEQIAKRWYLVKRESTKKVSKEVKEAVDALLKGTYLEFGKRGKYVAHIFNIKEKGKWEFGRDNHTIITSKDGTKKVWNIISVSDDQLILVHGLRDRKWTFKAGE